MSYTNGLDKPSNYFNTVIYSGSSSNQTISGVGFQSDMTWFKNRNNTANHALQNSVVVLEKDYLKTELLQREINQMV